MIDTPVVWLLDTTSGVRLELTVEEIKVRGRGAVTRGGWRASAPSVSPDARATADDAERAVARLLCALAVDYDLFVRHLARPGETSP